MSTFPDIKHLDEATRRALGDPWSMADGRPWSVKAAIVAHARTLERMEKLREAGQAVLDMIGDKDVRLYASDIAVRNLRAEIEPGPLT